MRIIFQQCVAVCNKTLSRFWIVDISDVIVVDVVVVAVVVVVVVVVVIETPCINGSEASRQRFRKGRRKRRKWLAW